MRGLHRMSEKSGMHPCGNVEDATGGTEQAVRGSEGIPGAAGESLGADHLSGRHSAQGEPEHTGLRGVRADEGESFLPPVPEPRAKEHLGGIDAFGHGAQHDLPAPQDTVGQGSALYVPRGCGGLTSKRKGRMFLTA